MVGDLEREAASSILQIPMIPIASLAGHYPGKLSLYDEKAQVLWSMDRKELGPLPHVVLGLAPYILVLSGVVEKAALPVKQLCAIDPGTGAVLWKRAISGELSLDDEHGVFYAAVRDEKSLKVSASALSTGSETWKADCPGIGSEGASVDFLAYAGAVFVADMGVLRLEQKGVKWKRPLPKRISEQGGASGFLVAAQIKRGEERKAVNGVFAAGSAESYRSLAVSNYRYASSQYSAAQRSGSSAELQLSAANKSAVQAQQQAAESMALTLQAINSIQNATIGIINVAMAAFDEATGKVVKGISEDLTRKVTNAASLQLLALNGKYFARPYRRGGIGLAIVDLETRSRTDIPLAPDSMPLRERQFIA